MNEMPVQNQIKKYVYADKFSFSAMLKPRSRLHSERKSWKGENETFDQLGRRYDTDGCG